MKIRQIEIKDFGSIKNKTLKFTSGLNVLYDEKEQMREEVRTFIEKMLLRRTIRRDLFIHLRSCLCNYFE